MLATDHQKKTLDVGIMAGFDINHAAPLYTRLGVIPVFACDRTGLASYAPIDIDDHAPARVIFHRAPGAGHR